ncbi:MAG: hypothetical protein FJZ63_07330 [Chlamydiae bacterium]|nr:hypothetical protein [Chlamydiota bacterium]
MATSVAQPRAGQQPSVFRAGLPYGVATLAVGVIGAYVAVTTASTAAAVAGVALGLFGAYGAIVTMVTAYYSKDAADFKSKIHKALGATAVAVVSQIISTVAEAVLNNLIGKWLSGKK